MIDVTLLGTAALMPLPDRALTAAALTREEGVLMLLDGSILTLTDGEGMRELPGVLDRTASKAWFTLLGFALIALAAAALLWLLLCALRQGYASLVLFRGSIFVSAAIRLSRDAMSAWVRRASFSCAPEAFRSASVFSLDAASFSSIFFSGVP